MSDTPKTDAAFSEMLGILSLYEKHECYFADVANVFYSVKCDLIKIEAENAALREQVKLDQKAKELMLRDHFREVDDSAALRADCVQFKLMLDAEIVKVNALRAALEKYASGNYNDFGVEARAALGKECAK
jgi:hypothetical protein